ncbi:hypothetical protein Patl1_13844 [Pistacia atlantica]|uniref:Uncharacterized protein n=1 Tax=Pistacia atlantica TaxID=434234 RepID=A0ACC1AYA1_9ROSI|nr:hypothetical protein Patl1_13844 [Pistacia atlantica]
MPDPNAFKRFLPVEESYVGSVARSSFPGYLTPKAPSFVSHQPLGSSDLRVASDFPQREISAVRPSPYGLDETAGIGVHPEPVMGAITAGASVKGYSSPPQDPSLIVQRRDVALGIGPPIPGRIEIPNSLRNALALLHQNDICLVTSFPSHLLAIGKSKLFTRSPDVICLREYGVWVSVLQSGDKAMVLCFVEFMDSKCAVTAMEALNGTMGKGYLPYASKFIASIRFICYKFDDKKPESPTLRIQFAQFPFRPSDGDEQRIGIPR